MAGLNAPTAPLMTKSSGNVQSNVNNLRTLRDRTSTEAAFMGDSLQTQLNNANNALMSVGGLTDLTVTDATGALVGWVGQAYVGNVNYFGAWFKTIYLGGSSAATAQFQTNANGDVIQLNLADQGAPITGSAGYGTFSVTATAAYVSLNGGAPIDISTPPTPVVPGNPNTSVQFNNAGVFAGSSDLEWDNTAKILSAKQLTVTTGGADVTGSSNFHTGITLSGGSLVLTTAGNINIGTGQFIMNGTTIVNGAGNGFLTSLSVTGAIASTGGSITANGNLTATTGNVTATAGNLVGNSVIIAGVDTLFDVAGVLTTNCAITAGVGNIRAASGQLQATNGISTSGGSIVNSGAGNVTLNTGVFVQNGAIGVTLTFQDLAGATHQVSGGIITS